MVRQEDGDVNGLTASVTAAWNFDMIRAALHLARGSDDQSPRSGRDLLARLAADRFQLAIVGQFSRARPR